ncbi:hypothetical protein D3C86_1098160 [compost metagenome]
MLSTKLPCASVSPVTTVWLLPVLISETVAPTATSSSVPCARRLAKLTLPFMAGASNGMSAPVPMYPTRSG